MKKTIIIIILILTGSSLIAHGITEEITVTHIEVPVRVLFKGKPVIDLNKDDFQLFENGIKQDIEGFYIVKKKIKSQGINLVTGRTEEYKPRYFVLVFRVYKTTDKRILEGQVPVPALAIFMQYFSLK